MTSTVRTVVWVVVVAIAFVIIVVLIGLAVLLVALEGPRLAEQIKQLGTDLPSAARGVADRVHHVYAGSGELSPRAETVVAFVSIYGSLGPRTYTRIAISLSCLPIDACARCGSSTRCGIVSADGSSAA